jgi:type IX secretion system PorP/SprF family membrane protein
VATGRAQSLEGDQYYINLPAQNPAFTGIDNFVDVQLRYRKTWSQFGSNPSILGFSIYGKSGRASGDAYRNNSFRVSDPSIYGSRPATIMRKHGFGMNLNSFSIGGYDRFTGSLLYAYHIPVGEASAFSMGASVQWLSERFNIDGLTVRDPVNDQFYQRVLANGFGTLSRYSISLGGAYYAPTFFVGLGTSQMVQVQGSAAELSAVPTATQFHIIAGKTWPLTATVALQPTARLYYDAVAGGQMGIGLRARYKDIFSAGLHYEAGQRISYLVSLNAMSKVRVYYAFDQFINEWKDFGVGNHEVIIRVPLFNARAFNSYCW